MTPYSHRNDPNVPAFDDTAPIAFMDGACALCAFGARVIAALDKTGDIRICPVQTPLGRAVLQHYGFTVDDPETWLYLEDGVVHEGFDAMMRVGRRSGGWGHLLALLGLLPRPLRRWLYIRLARIRYALSGRADLCALPDPRLRARLMQ